MQYRLLKQRWKSKAPWVGMGRSPIHEWGVFAAVHMKESTLVLEYVGEVIRQKVGRAEEGEEEIREKKTNKYIRWQI
jgi:SET domain-containing protein